MAARVKGSARSLLTCQCEIQIQPLYTSLTQRCLHNDETTSQSRVCQSSRSQQA